MALINVKTTNTNAESSIKLFPIYKSAVNTPESLTIRGTQNPTLNERQLEHSGKQPVKIPGSGEGWSVMPGLDELSHTPYEDEITCLPHVSCTAKPEHSQHASLSERHEDK
jgi:hypothetical protein